MSLNCNTSFEKHNPTLKLLAKAETFCKPRFQTTGYRVMRGLNFKNIVMNKSDQEILIGFEFSQRNINLHKIKSISDNLQHKREEFFIIAKEHQPNGSRKRTARNEKKQITTAALPFLPSIDVHSRAIIVIVRFCLLFISFQCSCNLVKPRHLLLVRKCLLSNELCLRLPN